MGVASKLSGIEVLIGKEELEKRIAELGRQISEDYKAFGGSILLICVLKGSVFFTVDLAKHLDLDVEFEFLDISSYGGTISTGVMKLNKDIGDSIAGRNVLLIEDIIDTGRTLSYLTAHLKEKLPANFKICTLLDKPDRRVVNDVVPEYVGFTIPDKFVIGYGLDYNQKYRDLDYIGVLGEEML